MKRFMFCMLGALCLTNDGRSKEYSFTDDARFSWKCVYPYSETNCDKILSSWSSEQGTPRQSIVEGMDCSECESHFFTDHLGRQHLLYAMCLNKFGARLTEPELLAPITKYKEGAAADVGWTVLDWHFTTCFDTWECGDYCSLETNPPTCLVYQLASWGVHVPVQGQACGYGSAPQITEQPTTPPGSGTQSMPQGTLWFPSP